jgi:hypothetical protein
MAGALDIYPRVVMAIHAVNPLGGGGQPRIPLFGT